MDGLRQRCDRTDLVVRVSPPEAAPGMTARPSGRLNGTPLLLVCIAVLMAFVDTGNTISTSTSLRPDTRSMLSTRRTIDVIMPDSVPSTNCSLEIRSHWTVRGHNHGDVSHIAASTREHMKFLRLVLCLATYFSVIQHQCVHAWHISTAECHLRSVGMFEAF